MPRDVPLVSAGPPPSPKTTRGDGAFDLQLPGARLRVAQSAARGCGSEGPALVFLHFFGESGRTWRPVVAELRGEFAGVALDLRGFGDSEAPAAGGFGVETMAADVAGVIRELGLRHYLLVGHSMGGKVALALAASARRPPGLAALALLAPSPPTPEPMPDAERREIAARVLRARVSEVSGARHLLPLEAPAAVAGLIRQAARETGEPARTP